MAATFSLLLIRSGKTLGWREQPTAFTNLQIARINPHRTRNNSVLSSNL